MTILLGHRPAIQPTMTEQRQSEWVHRLFIATGSGNSKTENLETPSYQRPIGGLPPVPVAEIRGGHRGIYASTRRVRGAAADGAIGLYASRVDAHKAQRLSSAQHRPLPALRAIGRGSADHYQQLHPSKNFVITTPEMHMFPSHLPARIQAVFQGLVHLLDPRGWPKPTFDGLSLSRGNRHMNSRRALFASLAVLMLMAGAATSKVAAEQYRYEVQAGDTVESIAAEFNVDPEGIYRSSWMPNGWDVQPGQVIVIPEPGQSPAEAATMAADLEGTSPWAVGAHFIQAGESFDTVSALWNVPVQHLIAFNPQYDPQNLVVGDRIVIPWERDNDVARPAAPTNTNNMISVPNYVQTRNLSCEFAATHAATTAFGYGIDEQTFIDTVPLTRNPHRGYRGNIDGWWGNTDDYGVYADALVPVLNANGFVGESFYSEGDSTLLKAHLDAGHPVVVWLGFWGDTRERMNDDGQYSVFAGMHVVTAVGYDDEGVYVMDPAKGVTRHYDWATFNAMWSIIDGMSLAVYPQ